MHVWFVCIESMHITRYRIAPRCTSKCPPLHGQGPPICQHSHPSHQRPHQPDGKNPPTFIHIPCEWDTACVLSNGEKGLTWRHQSTTCGASSKMEEKRKGKFTGSLVKSQGLLTKYQSHTGKVKKRRRPWVEHLFPFCCHTTSKEKDRKVNGPMLEMQPLA